jgi:hypothetical protein
MEGGKFTLYIHYLKERERLAKVSHCFYLKEEEYGLNADSDRQDERQGRKKGCGLGQRIIS